MDYNLLVCAACKQWVAIDVSADRECDSVSFDGNEAMEVGSKEDVANFCEQILSYYNIDSFRDLDLDIKIVLVSEYSNLIADLFIQMEGAKSVNVIDVKSIIPIYVLKNCIVKPGRVIDIRCLDHSFTLQVDDGLIVSYVNDKAGEEIVIDPESFSFLFRFDCENLIFDEAEWKALEEKCVKDVKKKQNEIDKQKKLYSELKKKYEELEQCYIQLQNEVKESESKFDDKRTILRFSTDQLEEMPHSAYMDFMGLAMSPVRVFSELYDKKYNCKLLNEDGEVVKKGTPLIEVREYFSGSSDKSDGTGRRSIIEANMNGRIFYLKKNNDSVKDHEAVVLLSDPADKRTDIMKWYEEMK